MLESLDSNAVLVVGGGRIARLAIKLGSLLNISDKKTLDRIGIEATCLNAIIVAKALNLQFLKGDPRKLKPIDNTIVTCGYLEGWTTDVDAAYAAKSLNSDVLFNLSREKGVYNKDPHIYKKSRLIKRISYDAAIALQKGRRKPGSNFIFDPLAIKICKENNIKIVITNKIKDVERYVKGKEIGGTIIG